MSEPTPEPKPPFKAAPLDDEANAIMNRYNARGVILVVLDINGEHHGISLQVAPGIEESIPTLLRKIANNMEREVAFRKAKGEG